MTRRPIVFMFSGQGSQYHHMARQLFDEQPPFRATLERLDRQVTRRHGVSLLTVLYDDQRGNSDSFDDIRYSHPAIFCVQIALAETVRRAGLHPDCVLGMSLGEFVAAAVAGALTAEAALEAVLDQAEVFAEHCPSGGMMAVFASPDLIHRLPVAFTGCELAGTNDAEHFVVAGAVAAIDRLQRALQEREILFLRLPVRQGFHSSLLDVAGLAYGERIAGLPLEPLAVPMISCCRGGELERVRAGHFWQVARRPMLFPQALAALERRYRASGAICLDLGPGGTLANFIKRLSPDGGLSGHAILTPFGRDAARLARVLAQI